MAPDKLRYLLFQVRKPDDPMRDQEVRCFTRALDCEMGQIEVLDLIREVPTAGRLSRADIVLMGGSGDYSVAEGGPWLDGALEAMRALYESRTPTFGSCWGFQAMAKALGGEVVTDVGRAEVGTFEIRLTDAGREDPIIGPLGPTFFAQLGHQDIVTRLPADATLLASSERNVNQAFAFAGRPIYCTQFHPELDRHALLERVDQYPEYVERLLGVSLAEFTAHCQDSPRSNELLGRFVQHVLAGAAKTE
jgi:GMP synthase (glutamine-hydrolysing)